MLGIDLPFLLSNDPKIFEPDALIVKMIRAIQITVKITISSSIGNNHYTNLSTFLVESASKTKKKKIIKEKAEISAPQVEILLKK